MKVICTNNKHHKNRYCPKPEVLSEYNVVNQLALTDGIYFELAEFPPEHVDEQWRYYYFHSKGFAILPDKSADEMADEVRECIVNIEKNLV